MTDGVRIRSVEGRDRPALDHLMATLQDHERGLDPAMLAPAAGMASPHMAHLLEAATRTGGIALIAEDAQTQATLGMLIGLIETDDGAFLIEEARRVGRITDLVVTAAARGRGIGTALIRAAESHFRALGLRYVHIGVLARNTAAQAVYGAAGYRDWLHLMVRRLDDDGERDGDGDQAPSPSGSACAGS